MKYFFLIASLVAVLTSCSQEYPGFRYSFFNGTKAEKLAAAVKDEDIVEIERLVEADTSLLNFQEPHYGNTLLMQSVVYHLSTSAYTLLRLGADPNIHDFDEDMTALMIDLHYTECNEMDMMKLLIRYGADVNAEQIMDNDHGMVHETVLMKAISSGGAPPYDCIDKVKYLVDHGADVNAVVAGDSTNCALRVALVFHNMEIVRYLIIDKKVKIPQCIYRTHIRGYSVIELLEDEEFSDDPELRKLRDELLAYLREKGYK